MTKTMFEINTYFQLSTFLKSTRNASPLANFARPAGGWLASQSFQLSSFETEAVVRSHSEGQTGFLGFALFS